MDNFRRRSQTPPYVTPPYVTYSSYYHIADQSTLVLSVPNGESNLTATWNTGQNNHEWYFPNYENVFVHVYVEYGN